MKQRFNIKNAKKCNAKTRQNTLCQSPAMKNGRCRLHGGKSTGAKTKEGIERIKKANLRHGKCTKEWIANHREAMAFLRYANKALLDLY